MAEKDGTPRQELTGEALQQANRDKANGYLRWLDGLTHDPQERILAIIDRYGQNAKGCPERTIRLLCKGIRVTQVLRNLREYGLVKYKVYTHPHSERRTTYWRFS